MMKKLILLLGFAICGLFAAAQALDYPIVKVDGKSYYSYTVQPKEGLYAIARKFSVSQADLYACNQNLDAGLKIGQVILVPVAQQTTETEEGDNVTIHEVQPQETLYSLSRRYSVPIDEITSANPDTKNGLKVGAKLRIPVRKPVVEQRARVVTTQKVETKSNDSVFRHKVAPKETLYSISRKYEITVEALVEANRIVIPIKVGDELIIPTKPTEAESLPTPVTKEQIEEQFAVTNVLADSLKAQFEQTEHLKVAVLMPFMLRTPYIDASVNYFWEFYRGVLLGLESVKQAGISVELHVYDIEKELAKLDSVLQKPELKTMDLIVGPAYANQIAAVSAFSRQQKIYTIVPLTSKIDNADSHEYLLQFNPSQERIVPLVAQTIVKRFSNQNFVIARFNSKQDKASMLADEVTKCLHSAKKSYVELQLNADNVDTLKNIIGSKRTLLLLATQRADVVATILPKLEELHLPYVQIWGFEEWKQWATFHDGTYYFSLFNRRNTTNYEERYAHWYGEHTVDVVPHYDLIGYDIINLMCNTLSKGKDNVPTILNQKLHQGLQSDFVFEQNATTHSLVNFNWFLFGFYNEKLNEIRH